MDLFPGTIKRTLSLRNRWHLLEKVRIHNSDKVLRIHRAREGSGQNEAERLNACIGDALSVYVMEEASSGRSTSRFMVCLWMRLVLITNSELETQRKANTEKKFLGCSGRISSSR